MSAILKKQQSVGLASAVIGAGSAVAGNSVDCSQYSTAKAIAIVGATSGTPDSFTLDIKLQGTVDGTTYYDIPTAAFTQITTASQLAELKGVDVLGYTKVRPVYTLAFVNGTAPKLTFGITVALKQ